MESCSCVVVFIWSFAGHISHLTSPVLEYVFFKIAGFSNLLSRCASPHNDLANCYHAMQRDCVAVSLYDILPVIMLKPLCCMN